MARICPVSGRRRFPSAPFCVEEVEPRVLLAVVAAEDAVVAEGTGPEATVAVFDVRLYEGGMQPVTVGWATADDTAAAPADYTPASGTLTFAPGETLKTVSVQVVADAEQEAPESFRLNLVDPVGASVVGPGARGDIVDDDASYVAVEDAAVLEGDAGTVVADFLVHRLGSVGGPATVAYSTADGTAGAGDDFTAATGTLTFAPGETEKHVPVAVRGDDADEGVAEEFGFNLTAVTGATVVGGAARGTIVDDDLAIISANSTFAFEGTGPAPTDVVFTVVRTGDVGGTSTVRYATRNDRAAAPSDFTAVSGTLEFGPGVEVREVHVPYNADAVQEGNEWFELPLTSATGATLTAGDARADIADDDASYVSIDDTAGFEAGPDGTPLTFTVRRFGSLAGRSTVQYKVGSGPAETLTFDTGESTKTIDVRLGHVFRSGQSVDVNLSNPAGTNLFRATARGYVVKESASFAWVSGGGVVVEGTGPGQTFAEFTAHRIGSTAEDAQVGVFFTGETATPGSDYDESALEGDFSFLPGETESTIRVPVLRDAADEGTETFTLSMYLPNNVSLPTQGGTSARAMIVDDDGAPTPGPDQLYVDDVVVAEGDAGTGTATFAVRRVGPATGVARVDYATADDGATAGSDYTAVSGTLAFAAGQTSATITVPVLGDRRVESATEAFRVQLSNPAGAVLTDKTAGVGVIVSSDSGAIEASDVDVIEGTGGTTASAVFTVYRVGSPGFLSGPTVVDYTVASGTATAGADFVGGVGRLTFEAGETEKTIRVPITGDDIREVPNERLTLSLRPDDTVAQVLNPFPIEAIIVDDDPSYVVADFPVVLEGDDPADRFVAFNLHRVGSAGATAVLDYATQNGTAGLGDYESTSGSVTFAPGEREKTVLVHVIGDTTREPAAEYFYLNLKNLKNVLSQDSSNTFFAGATIVDDDGFVPIYIPGSVTVSEAAPGSPAVATLTVRRFGGAGTASSTFVGLTAGPSQQGVDFGTTVPPDGVLHFGPDDTTKTIGVEILGDLLSEPVESFTVYATDNVSRRTSEVTVVDDDASWLYVDDPVVVEGDAPGSASVVFTVRRLGSTGAAASVGYGSADLTALAGRDYDGSAAAGRLTFAPGVASRTVTIPVVSDELPEGLESFLLTLSAADNASIVKGTGQATVVDDDGASNPPAVRQVYVTGSAWSAPFKQYLRAQGLGSADYGFAVPGGAGQLLTLPWTDVDRFSVTLDRDVSVGRNDLAVRGANLASYAFVAGDAGFAYDPATHTATWTFDKPLAKDRLLVDLHSAASGVNFQARLNVLPGDVDRSGSVLAGDYSEVKRKFFRSTTALGSGDAAYSVFHDVDGSGSILANDFSAVKARFFNSLPSAEPAASTTLFGRRRIAPARAVGLVE